MVNRANGTRANGHRANGTRADVVEPKFRNYKQLTVGYLNIKNK